uniref:Uncharacterized protein n=1 Tax=viral metagenome TaxID=1070528 RepID=A0A6M3INR5_9ZZZZ
MWYNGGQEGQMEEERSGDEIRVSGNDLVEIFWHDAIGQAGWIDKEDRESVAAFSVVPCSTVGYLISTPTKKTNSYTVARSKSRNCFEGIMTIPGGMFVKMRGLRGRKI